MADERGSILAPGTNFTFAGGVRASCVEVALRTKDVNNKYKPHTALGVDPGKPADAEKFNFFTGLLAQNVQAGVAKQPKQIYEIGSQNYYVVEARPSGSGKISHLIGPNTVKTWEGIKLFADVCRATEISFTTNPKSCDCLAESSAKKQMVTFTGGFLNSIAMAASSADYVLTSELGFMFFDFQNGGVTNFKRVAS